MSGGPRLAASAKTTVATHDSFGLKVAVGGGLGRLPCHRRPLNYGVGRRKRATKPIAARADEEFDHDSWGRFISDISDMQPDSGPEQITTNAITMAACRVAEQVDATAILCLSRSGFTVRSVTRFRPETPIYAFSPDPRTVRQLALSWGAVAARTEERPTAGEDRKSTRLNSSL